MEPKEKVKREIYHGGPKVSVADIDDKPILNFDGKDIYNEDGDLGFLESDEDIAKNKLTNEEIKIKALNQAVNIAKLMSGVSTDDVLDIAAKCAKFIKG